MIAPVSLVVERSIVWAFAAESKLTEIVADSMSHPSSIKSSFGSSESSPISLAIESANIGMTHSITLGVMSLVWYLSLIVSAPIWVTSIPSNLWCTFTTSPTCVIVVVEENIIGTLISMETYAAFADILTITVSSISIMASPISPNSSPIGVVIDIE